MASGTSKRSTLAVLLALATAVVFSLRPGAGCCQIDATLTSVQPECCEHCVPDDATSSVPFDCDCCVDDAGMLALPVSEPTLADGDDIPAARWCDTGVVARCPSSVFFEALPRADSPPVHERLCVWLC